MAAVDALNATDGSLRPARARLADLDAGRHRRGVLFHGSQNGAADPVHHLRPVARAMATMGRKYDVELRARRVGRHIYNEWLADFCSVQPERHVGLAHLPMWDIDAAVEGSHVGARARAPRGELPGRGRPGDRAQPLTLGRPALLQRPGVGAALGRVRGPRHDALHPRWRGRPADGAPRRRALLDRSRRRTRASGRCTA